MPMNPRLLVPRATFDPDAAAYLRAVEAADGQALETPVKRAVDDFFRGVKADGTFSAIKAACLLCGARTLAGALVPLVGTAPTNYNFVDANYNRETGLIGNGSTKYLDSGRASTDDPADDFHISAFQSTAQSFGSLIQDVAGADSGSSYLLFNNTNYRFRGSSNFTRSAVTAGFVGGSVAASVLTHRANSTSVVQAISPAQATGSFLIFARQGPDSFSNARIAFYSIGESLDLALLDARVSALITAIGAAL